MQPLISLVVGYITGIIWGRYLKTSIAPIIFLLFLVLYLFSKKYHKVSKYKWSIVLGLVFAFISNIQIMYLENKFDTLYKEINEVKVTRDYSK